LKKFTGLNLDRVANMTYNQLLSIVRKIIDSNIDLGIDDIGLI
jgi:hypothetical protein